MVDVFLSSSMSQVFSDPNSFTQSLFDQLKRHPKRIVFTEGEDIRIIRVAAKLVELEIGVPILLGRKDRIKAMAEKDGLPLTFVRILNPVDSADFELFCDYYERFEHARGVEKVAFVKDTMARPQNFGAMMVQYGHADALVGGNDAYPATVYRSIRHLIKPMKDSVLFSTTVQSGEHLSRFGRESMLILADTGVIPDPDSTELAAIAIETGKLARHILGRKPRIVMLSHSTRGSGHSASADKVRAATKLAQDRVREEFLELEIDGELQADVALNAAAAELKLESEKKQNAPDVLIFPNLDAAHISSKLLSHVAGASAYGNLVLGLSKPTAQLPMTADEDMILGTAALVAVEAIKFNELHLTGEI